MPKNKAINLLPQEEFEASTIGRVLRWAMGSFRIIVIVTEMIVMAAFLSRFWLDAENSDISESIKIASSQIQVQSDFEREFRGVQTKLAIYKQINSEVKSSDKFLNLATKTPPGVTLTSVMVHDTTSDIKGVSDTETAIAQFVSNLKNDPTVKKISLGALDTSDELESRIAFQVNISY
jgi:Tfp pilus assembly protein PilN